MEAGHCMGEALELQDQQADSHVLLLHLLFPKSAKARSIWPYFEEWVQPNLGKKDLKVEERIQERLSWDRRNGCLSIQPLGLYGVTW